jgi:hypothetical protein
MKYLKSLFILLAVTTTIALNAQEVPKGFELLELINIHETYQRYPNLSFDMTYTYADSSNTSNVIEQTQAKFKMQLGRVWSKIDSVEFIQGNMYNVAVYHNDSVMMVSDRLEQVSIFQLPVLDSIFMETQVDTIMVSRPNDSTRCLVVRFNPSSYYKTYQIHYNPYTYLIRSVIYYLPDEDGITTCGTIRICIDYGQHCENPIPYSYFDESKFIFSQGAKLFPKAPYDGFDLYINGIAQE